MTIRPYTFADCSEMATLFYETVHTVNAQDYTQPQLDAWATGNPDEAAWNRSFLKNNTLVAQEGSLLVGFGDMDETGYLDRLYVHKNYQGRGIATALVKKLEQQALQQHVFLFTTHASITAKPFFEKQGYRVVRENTVVRGTVKLTNFIMQKSVEN